MKRAKLFALFAGLLSLILLVTCQSPIATSSTILAARRNTLTVWSFFPNQDMDRLVKNYEAVHPRTKVIHTGYAFSALAPAFWERASQG